MGYRAKSKRLTCAQQAALESELRRYAKYLNAIPLPEMETLLKVCRAVQVGDFAGVLPSEQRIYQEHKLLQDTFSIETVSEHNRRKAKNDERTV